MAEPWLKEQTIDIANAAPVALEFEASLGDRLAHTWKVSLLKNSAAISLAGATVTADFLRMNDRITVALVGSVSGNVASVTLTQECYAVAGEVRGAMRVVVDGAIITTAHCVMRVKRDDSDAVVTPGEANVLIEDLLANEASRVSAESDRAEAEGARVDAEAARAAFYDGFNSQLAAITPVVAQVRRTNLVPLLKRYEYPAWFAFNNGTVFSLVFHDEDGNFFTPYDVASCKVSGGSTLYVNTVTGLSGNNGLTRSTPKPSLESALNIASNGSTIIFTDAEGTVIPRAGWKPNGIIPCNVNIIAENHLYVFGGDVLTYAKTAGRNYIYQSARSNVDRVVDVNYPEPIEYTKVASLDACDALFGSWYTDGTTLYVNTITGAAPNAKILNLLLLANPLVKNAVTQNVVCYLENITLLGGARGVHILGDATYHDHEIYSKDCKFLYATGNNDAFLVQDAKRSILQRCVAAYSRKDGFNYSSNLGATGRQVDFVEIDCDGYGNGDNVLNPTTANTYNGSTAHAGCRGVRINGNYPSNVGGNVVDIADGTKTVNLGCTADNSRASSIDYNQGFGMQSAGAEMELDGCKASGNYSDLYALTGSTMHVKNTKFTTKNGGATWDIVS